MPVSTKLLLQRIPEGLPLPLKVVGGKAWIEESDGRSSHFPVRIQQGCSGEGTYEVTLEVTQGGHFLTGEEIASRPLKAWLACPEAAVRLVLNRDPTGGPLCSKPFELEGIETVVRPTLSVTAGDSVFRKACVLPCQEVRLYTQRAGGDWKLVTIRRGGQKSMVPFPENKELPTPRDRFNDLAAAIPTRPSARPYGCGADEGRKQWEDLAGFRMRTSPPTPTLPHKGVGSRKHAEA